MQEQEVVYNFNEIVIIKYTPVWCYIVSNNSEILLKYIYDTLVYQPDGFFFAPQYQDGKWDGINHLFKPATKKFRVGLIYRVIELLSSVGCQVQVTGFSFHTVSKLKTNIYKNAKGEEVTLRFYQEDAVLTSLNKRIGILKAPPRSGKTLISVSIIDNENSFPVIFFVRSKDLAYQTLEVYKQNFEGKSIGFVCDGICEIGDINIITMQSAFCAYNKKYKEKGLYEEKDLSSQNKEDIRNLVKNAKVIFTDEVHHLVSPTSGFLYDKTLNATMKIGLSATPFSDKEDSILVEERTGKIIYEVTYSALIKEGYLMKPYIYMYKLPKIADDSGPYPSVYNKAIVNNDFLSDLVKGLVNTLNKAGKSVVVQTDFISHTKDIAKRISCEYLTGQDKTEKRKRILQDLLDKKILCVVSTLFEEGLDTSTLDYTINLAGGLSNISTFQRMRSITAHESKTTIGIIDFIHQCKYLKKHSKKRMDLYLSEPEFVVEIRDVSKKTISEIFS
ncbi:MAG: DEAD/DEAH box helicase family protein [Methanogenium sp.]|jgi:superfamily II DNA or RNA helicase